MSLISNSDHPDWLSQIKVLGWDLDGTLYQSDSQIQILFKQKQYEIVAKHLNLTLAQAETHYKNLLSEIGSNTKTLDEIGIDGTKFFLDFWDQIDLDKYIKKDSEIISLFEKLSHFKHFIISNSNRLDQIEKKLKLIGLNTNQFDLIVDTVALNTTKPEAKAFDAAINHFKVDANKILYIGDREETDILGATKAGMRTCFVWGESQIADISIYHPNELLNLLS